MKKRYFVDRVDNHGSLVENDGTPRSKQITWGVFDRNKLDGEGQPSCVLDVDTRTEARRQCVEFNESEPEPEPCACTHYATRNVLETSS